MTRTNRKEGSRGGKDEAGGAGTLQVCTFRIGNRLFGIPILEIREICDVMDITPVFHAPPCILGYMNLRGQIHLVADIRSLFGLSFAEDAPARRKVVVFKPKVEEPFGILVDGTDEVVAVEAGALRERRQAAASEEERRGQERRTSFGEIVQGVCRLEKGLLVVLRPQALVQAVEKTISIPSRVSIPS